MRTYQVTFLFETRVLYQTKLKAANKYDAKAKARILTIPTTEQPTEIRIRLIKNKGDK